MKVHVWGKKEITVSVSAISFSDRDTVYLHLDKEAVEQLLAIPVQRQQCNA